MRRVSWGFLDNTVILTLSRPPSREDQQKKKMVISWTLRDYSMVPPTFVVEMELPALC